MALVLRPYVLVFVFMIAIYATCLAEERAIYLVLLEGEPAAFHGGSHSEDEGKIDPNSEVSKAHAKHVVESHDQLLQTTLETGSYNKLHSFKHVINGFSVYTTPSQARRLKDCPGVKLVEKDRGAKLMTTYTPEFLGLPKGIWTDEGGDRNAGEGVVIGFVDSGINPLHPSFAYDPLKPFTSNLSHFCGACEPGPRFLASSCNGKIVSARFFSAGAQTVATLNASVDFLSPFDAVGHGSHVASIAAGNAGVPVVVNGFFYGRASGMAPRARIAVYKAIYPTVGTLTDVVAAIDQAILDGVDILTLSVGPDEPPEDAITFLNVYDICLLFARRAGVFVVQAAGNKGPGPFTVVSFSPWAVGVAASSTDRTYPGSLVLGNGQKLSGVGLSGPTFGNGLFMYKLCFYNGTSTLTAIIDTAKTLGLVGFVQIANPNYGDFIAQPIPFAVSGIIIPYVAEAQVISQYYEKQNERDERGSVAKFCARAAIGEGRVALFAGRAPIVSRFSSRGPDIIDINLKPADVLKPDILAPGYQIWAAWSPLSALEPMLTGDSFALMSGSSMATPHVAGIAALIKQYNPLWTPSMIASAISTTATKYDNYGELIMAEGFKIDSLYNSAPFGFGGGLVNPSRAIDPGLVLPTDYEDYISFLCSLPGIDPATIRAATEELCNNSLAHPSDLNLPSVTLTALNGSISVRRIFKNVGMKPETYLCSVLPPNGTTVNLYPSWFSINPQGSQCLEIKFDVTKAMDVFSFGEVVLTGSLNHIVRIPLSVLPVSAI
ncbi:Subtilisin-like protease [Quillaja saponaria]|uniref:Subtilisin-like protease n=1 Tax=Quillaja saponaria TaxID=32244 RepID=A0AAD7PUI3_QUISA|nr:Subtilisin-like protease [Quillaja saponaria]